MRRLAATMIPAACAVLAVTAVAWADTYFDTNYHSGYLSPGEGRTTGVDWGCVPIGASHAFSEAGLYKTVALITPSGTWRRSARAATSSVTIAVSPFNSAEAQSWRKHAHCKNSENIYAFYMNCVVSKWSISNCV